jgi:hypothetical protein
MRISTRSSMLFSLLLTVILFSSAALSLMAWSKHTTRHEPTSSLQLSIVRDSSERPAGGAPKFRVELRNTGKDDLILNLGIMLANGRKEYPKAIVLIITDSEGKSRIFDLREPAFVAGRLDPLTLPLPIGATFSLPVDLANYWSAATQEFEYKLRGSYSIEAKFTGEGVSRQDANLDVKGLALMPYWVGEVTSNRLTLEVAN